MNAILSIWTRPKSICFYASAHKLQLLLHFHLQVGKSTMANTPTSHSRLQELVNHNIQHYQHDKSQYSRRLINALTTLSDQLGVATPLCHQIQGVVSNYDFDAATPANGYRSLLGIVDACVASAVKVNQSVASKRTNMFFKKKHYTREAESISELLTSLNVCLRQALILISHSKEGELYASDDHSAEFLRFADNLNTVPFYGRALGFQFAKSLRAMLKQISVGMAAYNEYYESNKWALHKSAVSVYKGGQYLNNSELRAKKLAHITKTASVDFLKSFWFLSESQLMYSLPFFVCPAIAVNKIITLEPVPLDYVGEDGRTIQIPIPNAHIGPKPMNVHLFSAVKREGMEGGGTTSALCKELIVHFHGGGFVAQSPRSHEIYLRDWAVQLNVPILSVDYSLAPEGAFPRPLQDALYGYMWARKHCLELGSTGERIIVAGDSAGGNLCVTVSLKCLELGLPLPAAIFAAYMPVLVSVTPSPSRVLTCMDPILPYGFLVSCLKAYAGPARGNEDVATHGQTGQQLSNDGHDLPLKGDGSGDVYIQLQESKTPIYSAPGRTNIDIVAVKNQDLSPWWANDDALHCLPPTSILTTELDPCLDDCVMFARRLKKLNHDITLDVLPGLPHGFLYFAMLNEEAKRGSDLCVQRIKQRLLCDIPS